MTYLAFFVLGAVLAAIYFGGLWWTVERLPRSNRPWQLYFASLVARIVLLGAALWLILRAGPVAWPLLIAFLVGFIVVRLAIAMAGSNNRSKRCAVAKDATTGRPTTDDPSQFQRFETFDSSNRESPHG